MNVKYGTGPTEYGPGVQIDLTGNEVAAAIYTYLVAHDIHIHGPRTITVNGELCKYGKVYVDPSGEVIAEGQGYSGRGETKQHSVNPETDRCVLCGRNRWNRDRVPFCDYKPVTKSPNTNKSLIK